MYTVLCGEDDQLPAANKVVIHDGLPCVSLELGHFFCWSEKNGDDHNLIVFQFFFFFGGWEAFAVAPHC